MKVTLIAKQKNADKNLAVSFSAEVPKNNKGLIIGTLLSELFGFMSIAKKHRTDRFLSNDVTDVTLKFGRVTLSTEEIKTTGTTAEKLLRAKMKLRNNAKGKKAFATLVYDLCEYMTRKVKPVTFEQLLREIETEIAAEAKHVPAELN